MEMRLLGGREVDLMNELLDEDGLGDCTLGDLVGATSMNDGDVGDADEPEDDLEVGAFEVVGLQGRAGGVIAATGDDDCDLLAGGETLEAFGAEGKVLLRRTTWSIQAFRTAGTLKLYMGVEITTSSAARSSAMSSSEILRAALCSEVC
jgi:hypothetical protein